MAKLDRLGWAAGIAFSSQGVRIGIRANTPEVVPRLRAMLPPGARELEPSVVDLLYSVIVGEDRGSIRRFSLGYADGSIMARSRELDEVLRLVENDLHIGVAAYSRDKVFVHAGVVAWQGRALLIPGSTCSGKTELTAALLRAGAVYYSDEFALLDGRGRVHPYPLALARRTMGPDKVPVKTPAGTFGATTATEPVAVGLVLATRYAEGATWRPRALSPGRAMMKLLRSTVTARMQPARSMAALSRVSTQAPLWSGPRGDVAEFVPQLVARLADLW